jgi:sugar/nucleoside kinase (ribokinase family)
MVLPGGERSIVSANSKAFGNIDAQPEQAWLEGANVVLLDGHYMTACQRVSGLAHSRSIPVVLDCGSWKDGTEVLLSEATAVICSNDFRPPGATDAEDVFRFLTRFGLQQIAITRGPDPILFVDGPRRGELAVPQVDAVDTCGAGDIFHGAFCYVFAGGQRSFVECLDSAAQIASISCTYLGTRSWMKTRQAVVGK